MSRPKDVLRCQDISRQDWVFHTLCTVKCLKCPEVSQDMSLEVFHTLCASVWKCQEVFQIA